MNDPIAYILFAALVGAAIGIIGTALYCSAEIRRERRESWKEGFHCARREEQSPQ